MEVITNVKEQATYRANLRLTEDGRLGEITQYLNEDFSIIGYSVDGKTHENFSMPWSNEKKLMHRIVRLKDGCVI